VDAGFALGLVDPWDIGQLRGFGSAMPESCWVRRVGGIEGGGALSTDLGCGAVMDRGRGVEPDAGVAVDVVVVVEELDAEHSRVGDRAEPFGERRAVFQRLELSFGVRVVVRDVRSRMRSGDTEIDEQLRHRLGGHRRSTIGVQGEFSLGGCVRCRRRSRLSPAMRSTRYMLEIEHK
jgi:hypothetical protein